MVTLWLYIIGLINYVNRIIRYNSISLLQGVQIQPSLSYPYFIMFAGQGEALGLGSKCSKSHPLENDEMQLEF